MRLVFNVAIIVVILSAVPLVAQQSEKVQVTGFVQSRVMQQNTQFPSRVRLFLCPTNAVNKSGLQLAGESSLDFKYNDGKVFFANLNSLYLTVGLESHSNIYLLLGRRLNPKDFYLPPPNKYWFVNYPRASLFGPVYANAVLIQKDGGVISGMAGISDNGGTADSPEGYHGSDTVWRLNLTPVKNITFGFSGRVGKQANGRRDIFAGDITWQNSWLFTKVGFSNMKNTDKTSPVFVNAAPKLRASRIS